MADKMHESILALPKHLAYEPEVRNQAGPLTFKKFAFLGMGGSGLVGEALRFLDPGLDIISHKDYGLPEAGDLAERLLVCVSYSGNTEETVDGFNAALKAGHNLAVIATGGELLAAAKRAGVLFIELPDTGIQPRASLGLQLKAAGAFLGKDTLNKRLSDLGKVFAPREFEEKGKEIATTLKDKVPLIYASRDNTILAYFFKIAMNETGKIPAFWDVFPELSHNELMGFDVNREDRELSENLTVLILRDNADDQRIGKRMDVLTDMYRQEGLAVHDIEVLGADTAEKFFNTIVTAEWAAYHVALLYGNDPNEVPLVEEFKQEIKK